MYRFLALHCGGIPAHFIRSSIPFGDIGGSLRSRALPLIEIEWYPNYHAESLFYQKK